MAIIEKTIKKIDSEREYSLSDMLVDRLFPWTNDFRSVRKMVGKDAIGENVLKTMVTGEGRGRQYRIKGKNIIKFLEKYGEGLTMNLSEKLKQ